MPSWNRDSDRGLDAELRAARPEPSPEVTHAIADQVRPRHTARTHRAGRLHLALAGGLTALVLTPVVAMGFGGIGSLAKTTKAKTKHSSALVSKAKATKASKARARAALRTNRSRALSSVARLGGTSTLAAMAPAGGAAALASPVSASDFFGGVFAPQNDLQATQVEYAIACNIGAVIQDNDGTITQGGNTATGGAATATGGAGGAASTGNTQTNTGGATGTGDNTIVFGGNTTATSGNATGGAGGSATATGGDAVAGNVADQTLINGVICVPGP